MITARPFYSFPQERLEELMGPISVAIRSLPDAQLKSELDQLAADGDQSGPRVATSVLLMLYRSEFERRSLPDRRRDDELDAALSRLERQTNAEDRETVTLIGREIYRFGGKPSLLKARDRMLEMAAPARRDIRATILGRRWRLDRPTSK